MKQGVQYYGVCSKEDTEAQMQPWRWLANFAMLSLDGVRIKLQILGARIALDGVRAVGNYDGQNIWRPPKVLVAAKNLQKFWAAEILCMTQWPAKTTVLVSIRGVPTWKRVGQLKNSHLGTPRYQT
jgi:hypothetical protein